MFSWVGTVGLHKNPKKAKMILNNLTGSLSPLLDYKRGEYFISWIRPVIIMHLNANLLYGITYINPSITNTF